MISLESVLRQVSELNCLADTLIKSGRDAGFHKGKGFYQDPNCGLPKSHWMTDKDFLDLFKRLPRK